MCKCVCVCLYAQQQQQRHRSLNVLWSILVYTTCFTYCTMLEERKVYGDVWADGVREMRQNSCAEHLYDIFCMVRVRGEAGAYLRTNE